MPMAGHRTFRSLLLEGFMVLFGVLAALLVDQWREDRQIRHEVELAKTSLNREVEQNLRELEKLDSVVSIRVQRLRDMDPGDHPGESLADLTGTFTGFRVPSLSQANWTRISTGQLADHMPADYMTDAFDLYAWNAHLASLDDEIQHLAASETFHDPARMRLAVSIAEELMDQQIAWSEAAIPPYRDFLQAHAGTVPPSPSRRDGTAADSAGDTGPAGP